MKIQTNFNLKNHNTFGINAVADRFVTMESPDDYEDLLRSGLLHDGPFLVLGAGSNVILPDHYHGTVVHPVHRNIRQIVVDHNCNFIEASAGTPWSFFVDYCIAHEWYGLENLAGIPGTVGAAPVQNVGAYGIEAKDVIESVHYFDLLTAQQCWIKNDACQFGYRHSIFKTELANRVIVDRVRFHLAKGFTPQLGYKALAAAVDQRGVAAPTARQVADTVVALRNSKLPDPASIGSAGSFFKNPVVPAGKYHELRLQFPDVVAFPVADGKEVKLAAGWLIEHCGWKGRSMGNVGVYDKQALVLVNRGGCTGSEVRQLAQTIIDDVKNKFDVALDCEAIFV